MISYKVLFTRSLDLRNHGGLRSLCISIKNYQTTSSESSKPVDLVYNEYQPKQQKSPVPIVILHGLLGSRANWNSLAKSIVKRTHRKVYTLDARNHGDSPHDDEMTFKAMSADIENFILRRGYPKASVIGHSMGGRVMMALALLKPAMVNDLTVVDVSPVTKKDDVSSIPGFMQAMAEVRFPRGVTISEARKEANKQLKNAVQDEMIRLFILTNIKEFGEGSFGWRVNLDVLLRSMSLLTEFPSLASSYSGPTWFIGGALSNYIRREDHGEIRNFFPRAEFDYIEKAGHWCHSERPQDFLNLLFKKWNVS